MSFATTLVLGLLIGWLIEWVIDWFYWWRPRLELIYGGTSAWQMGAGVGLPKRR